MVGDMRLVVPAVGPSRCLNSITQDPRRDWRRKEARRRREGCSATLLFLSPMTFNRACHVRGSPCCVVLLCSVPFFRWSAVVLYVPTVGCVEKTTNKP